MEFKVALEIREDNVSMLSDIRFAGLSGINGGLWVLGGLVGLNETISTPITPPTSNRFIESLERVCTDMGKARAFIRLSLEKKYLSKVLQVLLSDAKLLALVYCALHTAYTL